MSVRSLIVGSLAVLSVGFSFASKIDTTLFEYTHQYDLKNLTSDLRRNYSIEKEQKNCDEIRCGIVPNYYQMEQTNDAKVRQFIVAMKRKRYTRAASLFNGINWAKDENISRDISMSLLPDSYPTSYGRSELGVIPFHEGLLGIISEGHEFNAKFFYITLKDNILYTVRMNGSIYARYNNGNGKFLFNDQIKEWYINTDKEWYINTDIAMDKFFYRYLQGKEKSKELDERQNAFKEKVKKLFITKNTVVDNNNFLESLLATQIDITSPQGTPIWILNERSNDALIDIRFKTNTSGTYNINLVDTQQDRALSLGTYNYTSDQINNIINLSTTYGHYGTWLNRTTLTPSGDERLDPHYNRYVIEICTQNVCKKSPKFSIFMF